MRRPRRSGTRRKGRGRKMGSKTKKPKIGLQGAIREGIEQFAVGKLLDFPMKLGVGHVFIVPSSTDLGGFYLVAWVDLAWICSCKGFRYSKNNKCRHIDLVTKETE